MVDSGVVVRYWMSFLVCLRLLVKVLVGVLLVGGVVFMWLMFG